MRDEPVQDRQHPDEGRVVITGLGTVNATARSAAEFARALEQGVCGIGPITVFDTRGFRTKTGGEVKDFSPRAAIPRGFSLKRMSRADLLAMAAAHLGGGAEVAGQSPSGGLTEASAAAVAAPSAG